MTDKAQARIRFFAAHWGQEFSHKTVVGNVFGVGNSPIQMMNMADDEEEYSVQLRLKPLSEMTAEDMGHAENIIDIYWTIFSMKYTNLSYDKSRFLTDFLRSRGYLLDFMGYDPIAEGWAVLTSELKETI